jgi:hypothetical protein
MAIDSVTDDAIVIAVRTIHARFAKSTKSALSQQPN